MIDSQLKTCGVIAPRTSAAFVAVPREDYVAPGRQALAYIDCEQPLGDGRGLMPPLSLGRLVEHSESSPADHVLIVGTATGYSAAILSPLVGSIIALESDPKLAERARANLAAFENVRLVEGPLEIGAPDFAPFDLILIDGAAEQLPDDLVAQLAEGGRLMAIILGSDGVHRASKGRVRGGILHFDPFAEAYAPLLQPFRKAPAFQF